MRFVALIIAFVTASTLCQAAEERKSQQKLSPAQGLKIPDHTEKELAPLVRGSWTSPLVVEISPASRTDINAPNNVSAKHEGATNEAILAYATLALATFTLGLMIYTALLWRATGRLVSDAKQTAKAQLRPYLAIESFHWLSHEDPDRDNRVWWSIHPVWKNGGVTPTKHLFLSTGSVLRDTELPADFVFPDGVAEPIRSLIGPHATLGAASQTITGDDLADVRDGRKFFYVWGSVRYRDVFPETQEHITRFCAHITRVLGNPTRPYDAETNIVEIHFSFYRRHNCMDEDCA